MSTPQNPPLPRTRRRTRGLALVAGAAVLALTAAACGSSSKASSSTSTSAKGSGPVKVLYAGSLVSLMTRQVGPAFQQATGYSFQGFSGDSGSLAAKIKGRIQQGDVFISASPTTNAGLEGAANGSWVSWYAEFASSSLVLGYDPTSKFAADLKSKPWYQVLTEPGIRIGRTNPTTDPKGKLTAQALSTGATTDSAPGLTAIGSSTDNVYTEETLVGRLQAHQLDVGFFYTAEANAAKIPTVPLTGTTLKATYTITVLGQAPDSAGAAAFVNFLLGSGGTAALGADGFQLITPPKVTGTGVPPALAGILHA